MGLVLIVVLLVLLLGGGGGYYAITALGDVALAAFSVPY